MNTKKWSACKDIINNALSLGYGYDNPDVISTYREIDGDFGCPTDSDIEDFRKLIVSLPLDNPGESRAMGTALSALNLYVSVKD